MCRRAMCETRLKDELARYISKGQSYGFRITAVQICDTTEAEEAWPPAGWEGLTWRAVDLSAYGITLNT